MTIRYNLPYIPDAVKRQRLLHLLEKNYHHQNFLITGQAAQGKSTLAASFLWQQNRPAIWFHLGPDDRDHHKLSDKLFRAVLGTCEDTPKGNDIFIPDTTLGAEDGVLRQIEGLSILLEEIPDTLVLVLDDFESIDEASTGFSMVKGLLSRRFDHIKFFILSRTIPALNMPRLKMEQNIFTLINEDLAFTRDEIQLFFPDILTHTDIEKIQQVTGGWAGGLTLVSESIRQFKALKNLPKRLSSEAFHFFSKEIYHNLPDQICEFLVKTSILDIIDLEAVNHIFSPVNALEILSELVKRNLFIQRIDSGPGTPQFKYHRLFKEFLLQELLSSRGEETFKRLHGKAGQFFWDKKDPERALHHFSRAKAFSDMVQIIKIKGTDYIIKGKISGLSQWLNCLPQDMIQQDPLLVLLLTMTRRIKGGRKNIRDFLRALELFEEKEDIRGILLSVAFLVEAAVFVRQPSATILSWIKKGEQHLDQFKGKSWFPWARAILWQKIGLGYIAGNGDIPKGISACRNAIILGQQIQNPDMILNASITLTLGYVQAGDFANARAMLSKMEGMTKEGRHPEYRALKNIVNIDFALKNGEFRTAGDLLARSEADIDKFGLIFLYPGFVEAQALHLIFTGAFHQARQMADHLYDFSILEGNDFYKGISHRIKALSYLKEKDFENAKTQITRALKGLDPAKKGDIHHFSAQALGGMILFHHQQYAKAKKMLVSALEYFKAILSDLHYCETAFALGLVYWEEKDNRTALTYFTLGLEKASQEGYRFFPLTNENLLIKILLIILVYHRKPATEDYCLSLISKCNPELVFEQIAPFLKQKDKNKYIENLRLVYKRLLPIARIETLGQFNIFLGNRLLDPKSFEGTRPVLLLKAIVLHGSRDIPKEVLIDDLWPKAAPKAGDKNFKTTLHRLRKAIEPRPQKEFGFSYILQKAGLISLDPELVVLDVDDFMAYGTKAMETEKNNKFQRALTYYGRAVDAYKGDYFAEEPYKEWIARKRDLLKARFLELLKRKARLHEELDQMDRAKGAWHLILEADPYYEAAYQNLMILYADSGQRHKAMDIFKEFCLLLKAEVGSEPNAETLRIFNNIRSR